jgi:hypothetical protein
VSRKNVQGAGKLRTGHDLKVSDGFATSRGEESSRHESLEQRAKSIGVLLGGPSSTLDESCTRQP